MASAHIRGYISLNSKNSFSSYLFSFKAVISPVYSPPLIQSIASLSESIANINRFSTDSRRGCHHHLFQLNRAQDGPIQRSSVTAPVGPQSRPCAIYIPAPDEIVIKDGAVAINPVDWVIPDKHGMMFQRIKDPFILATNVAGEVVEIGSAITRFKLGDQVVSHACGINKAFNDSAKSSFQLCTVLADHMTSHIPPNALFGQAAILRLGSLHGSLWAISEKPTYSSIPDRP